MLQEKFQMQSIELMTIDDEFVMEVDIALKKNDKVCL